MRIVAFMWVGLLLAACSSNQSSSDILSLSAQETSLRVGNSTVMMATLVDLTTNGTMPATDISWSENPSGIVTLTQQGELEQVTAVAAGQVVVTANGYGQTRMIGFTVSQ